MSSSWTYWCQSERGSSDDESDSDCIVLDTIDVFVQKMPGEPMGMNLSFSVVHRGRKITLLAHSMVPREVHGMSLLAVQYEVEHEAGGVRELSAAEANRNELLEALKQPRVWLKVAP